MKRFIFTILFFICLLHLSIAQRSSVSQFEAIGLRLADIDQGSGAGLEVSYHSYFSKLSRYEVNIGPYFNSGARLCALYQMAFSLRSLLPGLNFYAGIGANAGIYNNDIYKYTNKIPLLQVSSYDIGIGAVGQIGVEYNFIAPIQISFDWRPVLWDTYFKSMSSNGLAIRYIF
jgi:hypothetical protein